MSDRYNLNNPNLTGKRYPHRRHRDSERHEYNPYPYTVDAYIVMERQKGFLDEDSFDYITESTMEAINRSPADAWVHRWRHWRGSSVRESTSVGGARVNMLLVCCFEELPYQRRQFDPSEAHRQHLLTVRSTFHIYDASLDSICIIVQQEVVTR